MQETPRQSSIISYAGLSKNTLYALAKQALAQADFEVPERFGAFLPLFPFELIQNMDYLGPRPAGNGKSSALGFSIDPHEYHWKLYTQIPELYEGDNYRRNFDYEGRYQGKSVFTVDKAWAARFPQYQPFMGEKLAIYLIGGGHQAVAVPESLYPRGVSLLAAIERRMQITERVQEFVQYAMERIHAGEIYSPEAFGEDYLEHKGIAPVNILQSELGRVLQDIAIAKSLQQESPATGLFTENARRVEAIRQYVPYAYACDTFEAAPVTRHTARLCQPCFQGAEFISDLWIPYQDVSAYMDRHTMSLDMARLCDGYQIAPLYDPETGGGRYPDALRVVIVRDRDIPTMTGDVLNNPAYGGGMNPQGMIGRQVFIPDSRELLRQRKLMPEDMEIAAQSTALPPEEYRKALSLAALQETKGKLVDAMYRREAALSQMTEGSRAYEKAKRLLDDKVDALERRIDAQSAGSRYSQVSGYDADLSYLTRKALERESLEDEQRPISIAFEPDAQREQSVESGYAMRSGIVRMRYAQVHVPPVMEVLEEPQEEAASHAESEMPKTQEAQEPQEESAAAEETAQEEAPAEETPAEEALAEEVDQAGEASPAEGALQAEEAIQPEEAVQPKGAIQSEETEAKEDAEPTEEAPAPPAPAGPHQPHSFGELIQRSQSKGSAIPSLADLARQNRQKPVSAFNKKGKMASIVKKRPIQ